MKSTHRNGPMAIKSTYTMNTYLLKITSKFIFVFLVLWLMSMDMYVTERKISTNHFHMQDIFKKPIHTFRKQENMCCYMQTNLLKS